MAQNQSMAEGPQLDHPGARRWSPRWGRIGALLTLLIPLAMLVVGWASRGIQDLPAPQTRPGRLPDAHWEAKASLVTPRADLTLAAAGSSLWAIGGVGPDGAPIASVERFDPASNSWAAGPALPAARSAAAATTLNEQIYLFGGQAGQQGLNPMASVLDTRTGQWRDLAPSPMALAGASAAEVGGTIYVVGGRDESGATTAAYAYTPASDSWRELAPLPTARHGLNAVTFNGKVYALGGIVDGAPSTVVEIFDPATGTWSAGLPMLGPMTDFGAVVYSGRIHAIAGSVQQVFDPRANKWVTDSPLPTPRFGQGVAVLGDTVYAVGGRAEGATTSVALVEGYLPGEAPTPDNFQLTGFNRGGSIAVVVGIFVTIGLMALMLRLGRRRPDPIDEEPLPATEE
jgi:N-acetylneuraminic acid mutarotase